MDADQILELVLNQDTHRVKVELDSGLDPNIVCGGQPLLHWACSTDAGEIVALLLDCGADSNVLGMGGDTPLTVACYSSSTDVVSALMKAGAEVNRSDNDGTTPLMFAAKRGDPEVLRLLLSAGADVGARDAAGRTALHWAVLEGDFADAAKTLIDAGVDKAATVTGLSAADYAERLGRTKCAALISGTSEK